MPALVVDKPEAGEEGAGLASPEHSPAPFATSCNPCVLETESFGDVRSAWLASVCSSLRACWTGPAASVLAIDASGDAQTKISCGGARCGGGPEAIEDRASRREYTAQGVASPDGLRSCEMLLGVRVDLPMSKSESPTAFAGAPVAAALRRPPFTGPTSLGGHRASFSLPTSVSAPDIAACCSHTIASRHHIPPGTMSEHAAHDQSSSRPFTSRQHIPAQTNGIQRSFTQLDANRYEDPRYALFYLVSRIAIHIPCAQLHEPTLQRQRRLVLSGNRLRTKRRGSTSFVVQRELGHQDLQRGEMGSQGQDDCLGAMDGGLGGE